MLKIKTLNGLRRQYHVLLGQNWKYECISEKYVKIAIKFFFPLSSDLNSIVLLYKDFKQQAINLVA